MKDDGTELELLLEKLRWLRLPGMGRSVEAILDGAARNNWTPLQIMNRLCDEERQSRINSAVKRRITDARFPEVNTIDGFDFDFDIKMPHSTLQFGFTPKAETPIQLLSPKPPQAASKCHHHTAPEFQLQKGLGFY